VASGVFLRDEATCSICLSFFKDPVSLDCGHNFRQACITQCWEGPDTAISCPQCRETFPQRTLRPNRQLGNMVEIEPFKLFCNQDQMLICVICRESQAHRAHMVVPIEEAAQEHKVGHGWARGWERGRGGAQATADVDAVVLGQISVWGYTPLTLPASPHRPLELGLGAGPCLWEGRGDVDRVRRLSGLPGQ
uniref:RING-type E3 ubiquitin transferase n=1 Tax=Chrysemys picta bellii TaxID=8478 RepID=A0A8C3FBL3_CHRPI